MTGMIDGIGRVVVFRNERKDSDKSPDYRILKARPRDEEPKPAPVISDDIGF